jgi:hypothetical protein
MRKVFFLLTLVCAIAPLVSATVYAQDDPWRYRAGLRNSPGSQRLSAAQLQLALDSLRHKTGFLEMRFDEAGFLTLGDRTRHAGGSATARELLMATVDGQRAFYLEAYDRSPAIAFARIMAGYTLDGVQSKSRIEMDRVQLDFADFAQLRGDLEAAAAFDLGFVVLHELVHGVLDLRDAVGATTEVGACDERVNRMRRELHLPERQGYSPRLQPTQRTRFERTTMRAGLVFVQTSMESGHPRNERFYLSWDEERVGGGKSVAPRSNAPARGMAAVRY